MLQWHALFWTDDILIVRYIIYSTAWLTFYNFLPPVSAQKVINHPIRAANARSISLKMFPAKRRKLKPLRLGKQDTENTTLDLSDENVDVLSRICEQDWDCGNIQVQSLTPWEHAHVHIETFELVLTLPKLSDSALDKLHGKLSQALFWPVSKVLLCILLERGAHHQMKITNTNQKPPCI